MSDHTDKVARIQSTQTGKEESRRKALRSFVASAAVSGSVVAGWKTPMVRSIILPAHAQTSVRARSLEDPCFLNVQCINNDSQIRVSGSGQVVGPADQIGGLGITLAISYNGVTQNRSTTTAANGSWSVDPVVFDYVNGVNSVNGVVSSGDLLFDPATCQTTFAACGERKVGGCEQCDSPTLTRIKWDNEPPQWTTGFGSNDCIPIPAGGGESIGSDFATISTDSVDGDNEPTQQTVTLTNPGCWIVEGSAKAAKTCVPGSVSGDCQSITFNSSSPAISHLEVIIACCD